MSILYIVATPIGNLEDISKRALRILSEVDLILCEDTRQSQKLLNFYNVKTPTLSYHQHSKLKKVEWICQLLRDGKNLALVSDAGTPGISDPGNKLVELANKELGDKIKIVSIPGPSALSAAASISGLPMDKFVFMGFPPHKKRRKKFFEKILQSEYPAIFYESPYRILKTLRELLHEFTQIGTQINTNKQIVVARELTKKFETVYRGTIGEVIEKLERDKIKGEFVVIVGK